MNKIKKLIKKLKDHYIASTLYIKYYKKSKLDSKMILLESQHGKQANGNIYYILKELSTEKYKDYKIYLSVNKNSKKRIQKLLFSNNINNVNFVEVKTLKYYKIISKAKYLINDVSFLPFFIKKEGQVYLNTWHGTPLKTLGRKFKIDYMNIGNEQKNFIISDYLLYPNEFTRDIILDDYIARDLTDAKVILEGYPRNTAFFEDSSIIKKKYNLEDKFVIAYMPTWRGVARKQNRNKQSVNIKKILDILEKKLKKNQILYVNLHPIEQATVDYSEYKKIKPFPEICETYEFLNIADVLITDYSSVFFDFAITKKKIILYPPDKEDYLRDRGMYFDMEELPFPIVYNIKDLVKEINSEKIYDDKKFLNKYCKYDNKDVTKNICERVILNKNNTCRVEEIKKNNKENVLIYAGDLSNNNITMTLKGFFNNVDLNEKNYFIYFDAKKIKRNDNMLLDMSERINFISARGIMNLSLFQKIINKLYNKKKIKLKNMLLFLKKSYDFEIKRIFGNSKFSTVIQFNSSNYKKNIILSKINCNKVIYLFNERNCKLFFKGKQNKDMLKYVLKKYDKILIENENIINKLPKDCDLSKLYKFPILINYEDIKKYSDNTDFIGDYTITNVSNRYLNKIVNEDNNKIVMFVDFNDTEVIKQVIDSFNKLNKINLDTYLFIIGQTGKFYNEIVNYSYNTESKNNIIVIRNLKNYYPILKTINNFILYDINNSLYIKNVYMSIIGSSEAFKLKKSILSYTNKIDLKNDEKLNEKIELLINDKYIKINKKVIEINKLSSEEINKIFKG